MTKPRRPMLDERTFDNICKEIADELTLIEAYSFANEPWTGRYIEGHRQRVTGMYEMVDVLGWREEVDKVIDYVMPNRIKQVRQSPRITNPHNRLENPSNPLDEQSVYLKPRRHPRHDA